MVRGIGCGGAADRLPVAAGRHVSVLSQAGGQGLESRDDLRWHVPVHDPAGDLRWADDRLPRHCDLVPAHAERGIPPSGDPRGVQENPGTAEAGTVPGRRRLADTKKEVGRLNRPWAQLVRPFTPDREWYGKSKVEMAAVPFGHPFSPHI